MNESVSTALQSMRETRHGIVLIVLGLSIAAMTGAIMKLLSDDLSAYQITWFRFAGFALVLLPVVYVRIGRAAMRPARPRMQVVRGITMAASTVAFVIGARTIDYADAIAILYAYPFLLTLLAVLFLDERVGWTGWVGVIGGFIGVLLVMRPSFSAFNAGTLFVFLCAAIVSIQMTLNRKLGALSHPLVTSFWGALVAAAVLSLFLPFYWQPVDSSHALLICLMVISGALNQTLVVFAFAKAPASTLAPFTYFEIVAAVVIGFVVFGTLPVWISWLGILLISASGLLVARSFSGRLAPRRNPKF
ncbi:MAG: DMT family transporter [bacterium]